MATATGSGIKLGPTLVVIALVIAAGAFLSKGRTPQDDDVTEEVVLSVIFKPSPRIDEPVHVQAHVESVQVENTLVSHSSFKSVITIPRGAQVSLYALQDNDGELDCVITVDGHTVDTNHRDSAGSVRCWHNRKN